jgi:hypothetical protein
LVRLDAVGGTIKPGFFKALEITLSRNIQVARPVGLWHAFAYADLPRSIVKAYADSYGGRYV